MQYTELKASCSRNMVTGESWWKFEPTVSLTPGEDIFEAAKQMKADINKMLSHGEISVDYSAIPGHPMYSSPDKILHEADKPEMTQEEALIKLIQEDCRTVSLLERQRKQVERINAPRVTEAFNNKMKNLKGEHN